MRLGRTRGNAYLAHAHPRPPSIVTVSYHATQQLERLSPPEPRALQRALESGELQAQTMQSASPGRFVSRFGADKRVVWSRDGEGNIVVLTVVAP